MEKCPYCKTGKVIWYSDYCYDEVFGEEGENGIVSFMGCLNEECDVEIILVHTWDENEENDEYKVHINRYDDNEIVEEIVIHTNKYFEVE